MKAIFVVNGVVVGLGTVYADGVTIASHIEDAQRVDVPDNSPVGIGWMMTIPEIISDPDAEIDPVLAIDDSPIEPVFSAPIIPVINFSYPQAAAKDADITVNLSVVNPAGNAPVPVNETYYVPLMNVITGAMDQMLVVPIIDGDGHVTFSVPAPGRYSIKTDLILPKPTARFSETPDIAIY